MTINKIENGTTITIIPEGRIDTVTAPEANDFIMNSIKGKTELILDFSKLDYISSAGIRVIMKSQKVMNKQGKMKLTNVNSDILEILDIVGLSDVLDIE